jgi:hypothetical protein
MGLSVVWVVLMQLQAVFVLLLDESVGLLVQHAEKMAPSARLGRIVGHRKDPCGP